MCLVSNEGNVKERRLRRGMWEVFMDNGCKLSLQTLGDRKL